MYGVDLIFMLSMTQINCMDYVMHKHITFIAVLGFVTPCVLAEQVSLPQKSRYKSFFNEHKGLVPEYRLPTEKDFKSYWLYTNSYPYKTTDYTHQYKAPYWTSGDWNSDGVVDYAYILCHKATSEKFLYSFTSEKMSFSTALLSGPFKEEMAVATETDFNPVSGNFEEGPLNIKDAKRISVRDSIAFFYLEGAGWVYVWDEAIKKFHKYKVAK